MLDRSFTLLSAVCFFLFPRNHPNLTQLQVSERPEFTVAQQRFLTAQQLNDLTIPLLPSREWFCRAFTWRLYGRRTRSGWGLQVEMRVSWQLLLTVNCKGCNILGLSNKSTEQSAGALRRSSLYWWLVIQ